LLQEMTKAFVRMYRAAPVESDGEVWYRTSRGEARRLARKHGVTVSRAAGVIAALSPRVQWSVNVRMADALLGGQRVRGLGLSVANARRIRRGERPLDVLNGPKTRAFYRAIMGDEDAAVIDVWMMRAAGRSEASPRNAADYDLVSEALRRAARQVGRGTATFQAIVWTQVRGAAA